PRTPERPRSLQQGLELLHQRLGRVGRARHHEDRVLAGERPHDVVPLELVDHVGDPRGVPLVDLHGDDVLAAVEVAHEELEALPQLRLDVLLPREWRDAVAVLTLAGGHAHEAHLGDVAADRGLRHAYAPLGQLLRDLRLGGEELVLHQLGDQSLPVLLARHDYAVYAHHASLGRPRGPARQAIGGRRAAKPPRATLPARRPRSAGRSDARARRARSPRALTAALRYGPVQSSSSSNGLLNVCGVSGFTGSTVRRTSSSEGSDPSSPQRSSSESSSSFMASDTVFSFFGTSSGSRTVGTPNLSCAARFATMTESRYRESVSPSSLS